MPLNTGDRLGRRLVFETFLVERLDVLSDQARLGPLHDTYFFTHFCRHPPEGLSSQFMVSPAKTLPI